MGLLTNWIQVPWYRMYCGIEKGRNGNKVKKKEKEKKKQYHHIFGGVA